MRVDDVCSLRVLHSIAKTHDVGAEWTRVIQTGSEGVFNTITLITLITLLTLTTRITLITIITIINVASTQQAGQGLETHIRVIRY